MSLRLHDQALLAGVSDELLKVVEPVNEVFTSVGCVATIVPTEYGDCLGFSIRTIPPEQRESTANEIWKKLGVNYLVHLFPERVLIQWKKPS